MFVAIDLPEIVRAALVEIQPPVQPGVRSVPVSQMHLTLHFLGERPYEPIVAGLSSLVLPQFTLAVDGVGSFSAADGGTILWAGVRGSTELAQLHTAITIALAPSGFRPETRPYHPHLTLARCSPSVSPNTVQTFLNKHQSFQLPAFPIEHITLYSSTLRPEGPTYREELRVALIP